MLASLLQGEVIFLLSALETCPEPSSACHSDLAQAVSGAFVLPEGINLKLHIGFLNSSL